MSWRCLFSPLKILFLPNETRWGGLSSRDRYLWKASERLSNPPPANRRQDVSTKETAGQLAASCLPRPQPSFFLSFHSLFLVRKQRKTMLWEDWFHAPERPKQKGWARVPLIMESVPSRSARRHMTS